jgi:hypothetical protein
MKKQLFIFMALILLNKNLLSQTFTDVSSEAGVADDSATRGVAWGDYNGDGFDDLYVTNYGINHLFRNNQNGTFSDVTQTAGVGDENNGGSGGWADYDNDGDLDLFTTIYSGSGGNFLFQNKGDGSFKNVSQNVGIYDTWATWGMTWIDYDADGLLDLFLCAYWGTTTRLYRQVTPGFFQNVAATAGVAYTGNGSRAGWADYDNDGYPDLYLCVDDGPDRLYRNRGDGTFDDVTSYAGINNPYAGTSAAWGDYDNDGDLDLFVANYNGPERLYRNNGNGQFTDVAYAAGVGNAGYENGAVWGDYDNDGDLDLYISADGASRLYANRGNGTFADVTSGMGISNNWYGMGAGWCDYDRDGDLDLYQGNWNATNRLFRNEGNANNWIEAKLAGTSSNRSAIGSRIRVVAGGHTQIREISGGQGMFSQNSLVVHFGLGGATVVDSLIVKWPSGVEERFNNIPSKQHIIITEKINSPPVAVNDTISTPEEIPISIAISDILANDTDEDGDIIAFQSIDATHTICTVILDPDNTTITYTPITNFYGIDTFSYTISDGNLGGNDTAMVYITVTPVNDASVAIDDTVTTPEDTPITIAVLANDIDVDDEGLIVQSVDMVGTIGKVEINLGDTTIIYTPKMDFNGTDTFFYTISNINLTKSDTAMVVITVLPVNDAPCDFYLLSPVHGSVVDTLNPTLIWQEAIDIDAGDSVSYLVRIGSDSLMSLIIREMAVVQPRCYVDGGLEPNSQYYWNVCASDQEGAGTFCHKIFKFSTSETATGIEQECNVLLPPEFALDQNYPNPFNPATTISFRLPSQSFVSLKVFDSLGREVSILLENELPAGTYVRRWNAQSLQSGVYYCRLQSGSFTETKKLILQR